MRKLMFLFVLSIFLIDANAQATIEVPDPAKERLNEMYPNATNVKWTAENENFNAVFSLQNVEANATFDQSGIWLQTKTSLDVKSVPDFVKEFVATKLAGKKIEQASSITSANGGVSFEADIDSVRYLFDEGGNLLQTTPFDKADVKQ